MKLFKYNDKKRVLSSRLHSGYAVNVSLSHQILFILSIWTLFFVLSNATHSDVQSFIQQLREDVRPIEKGENGFINGLFTYRQDQIIYIIDFTFWTRYATHGQWACTVEVIEDLNNMHFKQFVYKSLFTDGNLYRSVNQLHPNLAFLDDFLLKGPQINSKIDLWMKEDGNETITDVGYQKRVHLIGDRSFVVEINREEEYELIIRYDDGTVLMTHSLDLNDDESLDEDLFKITDDLKPFQTCLTEQLSSGLLMGIWGLCN